ncbi:LytTR family DNA-binding domain-containing protein [Draconibacterium sp. IB214405]|uniref:LytR/AlgR family response regulator transcription factor n=1 Tax=Draconibacterium sp. IB214405 TaxID=3097352 RepID=UPI002A0DAF1D|nr:LytTR family DNA-binding domain-containing protein [Draconibacterium sp. IB214405]MDX8341487.1 LytTR family DNA-binding domain-containing protein [Draconibacterium sp. IB214405]
MRVIIVEDELHNYRLLRGMVEKLRPDWQIVEWFESVKSSVAWLQSNPAPDIIFMDIQLTDGISFSIFDQVDVESMVIFTTAYDEYALRAFQVNSIDYLLKPIKEDKLRLAIEKFEHMVQANSKQGKDTPDYKELLQAITSGEKRYRKRFLISGATSYFKLDIDDVAWFHTENRVTTAVTFKGKDHVIDLTIEKLEEQLDPDLFFRTNRSSIVNINAIRKFENHFGGKLILRLIPPFDEPITISRLKATEFKEWVGK